MEAVILAGGLGTRLRGTVPDLPKPLAPIGDRPFLEWLLDYLDGQGFSQVILSVGYQREAIKTALGDRHRRIALRYAEETHPLGTGGAMRLALAQAQENPVFVLNGDTFFALDFEAMLAHHRAHGARLSLALKSVPDTRRFGRVETRGPHVSDFREKGENGPGFINGGIYLLDPALLDGRALPESFSFEQDFLEPELSSLQPLAFLSDGYFIDIGVPEDYHTAQTVLPSLLRKGNG